MSIILRLLIVILSSIAIGPKLTKILVNCITILLGILFGILTSIPVMLITVFYVPECSIVIYPVEFLIVVFISTFIFIASNNAANS